MRMLIREPWIHGQSTKAACLLWILVLLSRVLCCFVWHSTNRKRWLMYSTSLLSARQSWTQRSSSTGERSFLSSQSRPFNLLSKSLTYICIACASVLVNQVCWLNSSSYDPQLPSSDHWALTIHWYGILHTLWQGYLPPKQYLPLSCLRQIITVMTVTDSAICFSGSLTFLTPVSMWNRSSDCNCKQPRIDSSRSSHSRRGMEWKPNLAGWPLMARCWRYARHGKLLSSSEGMSLVEVSCIAQAGVKLLLDSLGEVHPGKLIFR